MLSYEGYFLFVFYFILPSQLYCTYAIENIHCKSAYQIESCGWLIVNAYSSSQIITKDFLKRAVIKAVIILKTIFDQFPFFEYICF